MKYFVFILCLSYTSSIAGQKFIYETKFWVSKDYKMLFIVNPDENSESSLVGRSKGNWDLDFRIHADTLSFQFHYQTTGSKEWFVDRYDFKLLESDAKTILIRPCSEHSIAFFESDTAILFTSSDELRLHKLKFQGLDFEISNRKNGQPYQWVSIGKRGKVNVKRLMWNKEGAKVHERSQSGEYSGKLNKKDYRALKKIIREILLQTDIDYENNSIASHSGFSTLKIKFNDSERTIQYVIEHRILRELNRLIWKIKDAQGYSRISN